MSTASPSDSPGPELRGPRKLWTNLEALRFFAAAMVMAHHLGPHVWAAGEQAGGVLRVMWLLGVTAPDVFFVVSGAVIWLVTLDRAGPSEAWDFLRRRLARIYSGYWVFLGLAALVAAMWAPVVLTRKDWLASALLWPQSLGATAIPVSWTLTFEVYLYIMVSALVALRRRATSLALAGAGAVVLAGAVYSIMALDVYARGNLAAASWLWRVCLSPFCLEFVAGCALSHWAARRALPWPRSMLVAGVALCAAGAWINSAYYGGALVTGYFTPERVVILGPGALVLVAGLIAADQRGWAPWPRLAARLGLGTYALYLVHTIVLDWTYWSGTRQALAANGYALEAYTAIAIALIAVTLIYAKLIERPLYRLALKALRVS